MNKLSTVMVGLVLAGINATTHASSTNDLETTQIKSNLNQCSNLKRVSSESLFGRMHSDVPFLFSKQICLYSVSAKKSVKIDELDTRKSVFFIADRYQTALKKIDNSIDRLNFVKSFLTKATKEYFIMESFLKEENSVAVTLWGKSTKGKLSGVIITLLDKNDIKGNEDVVSVKHTTSTLNANEIKSLVNYVISGKKR